MKRLILICMLVALVVPAPGLVGQVGALSSTPGTAQSTGPDEAFIRSVALTEQSSVLNTLAGPSSAPFGTLSMGPIEIEAYVRSLAQTGQASAGLLAGPYSGPGAAEAMEAFIRSVALTEQSLVPYATAGLSSAPFGTLSMGPTEVEAYVRSLAQVGQGSTDVAGGGGR